jgi:acetylxylan esterase
MIVARASLEAAGQGIIGAVATHVQSLIAGSDSEAVVYPATLADYVNSEEAGVAGMQSLIDSYEARCPDSKIALLGYSQGAHVVADILCGASEDLFNVTAPEMSKNIIASVQMGDPSFALKQPQDVGNATKGGIFHRNNTAACPSSIMKSYCDFNDTFCDSGSSLPVHLGYVQEYGNVSAMWIVEKFLEVNGTTTTNGTTTPSGTSTPTPTSNDGHRLGESYYLNGALGLVVTFLAYAHL